MRSIKILCPAGHLGFTPMGTVSFEEGCKHDPDFVIADSGSCDLGPHPLGADVPEAPEAWQRHDLELMLKESRRRGVPMIVGSSSDAGTNRGVDQFSRLIEEIAAEHHMEPFKMAKIYSEVPISELKTRLASGTAITGLDGVEDAGEDLLDRTDRAVAVMGAEPIQAALDEHADVIICGRSSDAVLFAAPLLNAQFSPAISYYAGKVLECGSFCAEPFMGMESVLGRIQDEAIYLTALHPEQRCTPLSVAGHAMYERISPLREYVAGGYVDMSACHYEQIDEKTTRVTGATFVRDDVYKVKLEGAAKVGERRLFVLGIRDPSTIERIDQAIALAKGKVTERFGPIGEDFDVFYHVYGRNGVMGELDPSPPEQPYELGLVVEVVAPTAEAAEEICAMAARSLFFMHLPGIKGTAGAAALMSDEILIGRAGYQWTLNHVMAVDNPHDLFTTSYVAVDGASN